MEMEKLTNNSIYLFPFERKEIKNLKNEIIKLKTSLKNYQKENQRMKLQIEEHELFVKDYITNVYKRLEYVEHLIHPPRPTSTSLLRTRELPIIRSPPQKKNPPVRKITKIVSESSLYSNPTRNELV
tara:strand:+ start:1946 stop:2326 length:381 start_codon:yes stop_codon:yes gene_type:complete